MLTESISASVVVFAPRATLAVWMALLLLLLSDGRKASAVPAIVLALLAAVGSAWHLASAASLMTLDRVWWAAGLALACLQVFGQLIRWITTSPVESHEQAGPVGEPPSGSDAKVSRRVAKLRRLKTGSASENGQPHGLRPTGTNRWLIFGILLGSCVTLVGLVRDWTQVPAFDLTLRSAVWVHQFAAIMLWAVAMVSAVETTYLSSPDALNPQTGPGVHWRWLAAAGGVGLIAELALCGFVFFQLDVEAGAGEVLAVPVLFLIALLVIDFVTWMVPHRIRRFQRDGRATGWASLTLASWLAVLSFALVLALPVDWPWKLLLE